MTELPGETVDGEIVNAKDGEGVIDTVMSQNTVTREFVTRRRKTVLDVIAEVGV